MYRDTWRPSWPDTALLTEHAPQEVWHRAFAQAQRSPMPNFRTGAVLFDTRSGALIAAACSYPHGSRKQLASQHAELSLLRANHHRDLRQCAVAIVTINRQGSGCAWSSAPCEHCARALARRGVKYAVFAVRSEHGWQIERDYLEPQNAELIYQTARNARHLQRQLVPAHS
jgi:deoxycytidylate deaminase